MYHTFLNSFKFSSYPFSDNYKIYYTTDYEMFSTKNFLRLFLQNNKRIYIKFIPLLL